jgi:hypothetical protein
MRVGLTYTQMKLGWGRRRLDELKREVEEFRKDSYFIRTEDDVEYSRYRIQIEQKITPDAIGMLVGEFAYALRSSLDHLAWQLALLTTDTPSRKTAFPIESQPPLPTNKSYGEKIEDVLPAALPVIESFQPYMGVYRDHPLWQLNKLCNIDKHCLVAVGYFNYSAHIAHTVSKAWWRDGKNGFEVSIPLAEKAELDLKIECPAVVFGDPIEVTDAVADFEIEIDGLERIYDFLRNDLVPKFDIFFK